MESIRLPNNVEGAIFDLDGVIVDTAKYHYMAWKRLSNELGFDLSKTDNERLKGVSRMESADILLKIGGFHFSDDLKQAVADVKNKWYVKEISNIKENELLKGAKEYLIYSHTCGRKTALGSASKNAQTILNSLKIAHLFDAIVDGNEVKHAKPDPEVFLVGASKIGVLPKNCVVFEDSFAGIQAAKRAGFFAVGIGRKEDLPGADIYIGGLYEMIP